MALLTLLLASLASCSGGDSTAKDTDTSAASGEAAVTEKAGYDYGDHDFKGYTFKVLNFDNYVDCFGTLTFEEATGEALNDAIYERNRRVEEELNFDLKEEIMVCVSWTASRIEICDKVINSVLAGEYAYDAAYLIPVAKPAVISEGYLYDLNTLDGLNLEEEYWDKVLNDSLTLNGKLYTASSALNFTTTDLTDVIYFNERLFTDYDIEFPYQSVRDGSWTLDAFGDITKKMTMLNGDDSFAFNAEGNSMYGIGGHPDKPFSLTYSAGCNVIERKNGEFVIGIDSERFHNSAEKIAEMFSIKAGHTYIDSNTASPGNCSHLFMNNRTSLIVHEIKQSNSMRNMEDTFGMLPLPKYDEAQESYRSPVSYNSSFLCVPMLLEDPERTGVILDALSYESYTSVLPIYYDVTVSQKGLRNEESIEMLEIIYNTRGIEFGQIFGITNNFVLAFRRAIENENMNSVSMVDTYLGEIEGNLLNVLDALA